MRSRILFFILACLSPLSALAYTFPEPEALRQMTLRACRGISADEIARSDRKKDNYRMGRTGSPAFDELLLQIQNGSAAQADQFQYTQRTTDAQWILIQPSFQAALRECYSTDTRAMSWFAGLVVLADTRGKVGSGVTLVGQFWVGAKIIRGAYHTQRWLGHAANAAFWGLQGYALIDLKRAYTESQDFARDVRRACQQAQIECSENPAQAALQVALAQAEKEEPAQEAQSAANFFETLVIGEIAQLRERLTQAPSEDRARIESELQRKRTFLIGILQKEINTLSERLNSSPEEIPELRSRLNEKQSLLTQYQ